MSDITDNIRRKAEAVVQWRLADDAGNSLLYFLGQDHADKGVRVIASAIRFERESCIEVIRSVETRNEAEAHLIETIIRRIRGDE